MPAEAERIVIAPGPVHVPPALRERIRPMHHRSAVFRKLFIETEEMLAELLETASPLYTITASGTGAMEAAVVNTARPGDRALVISGGKFGDRWEELLSLHGCDTRLLSFEPGAPIDIEAAAGAAGEMKPDIVACTHVESSTGLLLDLEALASKLEKPLVLVDAIASLGAEELAMDAWGLDVVVSASQKAFAAPPGLSFVAMSDRARGRAKGPIPYYLDLGRYEAGRERGDAPFTPAIDTVQMVHASLGRAREVGWKAVREMHRRASKAFIEALETTPLESFPAEPSAAVQAFRLPGGLDGARFLEILESEHGIVAAGGQGTLEGKIFRTGFLGHHDGGRLLGIVRSVLSVMTQLGIDTDVRRAEKAIRKVSDLPGLF